MKSLTGAAYWPIVILLAMTTTDKSLEDFLSTPTTAPDFLKQAERAVEWLRSNVPEGEDLQRYRETRTRLGTRASYFIEPPNFRYTVHSA